MAKDQAGMQSGQSTHAKKLRAAVAALKDWLKKSRSLPLPEIIATLKRKRQGYWNYDGVIDNSEQTWNYTWFAKKLVYKWLNRRSQRSQRKSFTVASFVAAWERWQMPDPQVNEKPWPRTARQNQPSPV